MVKKRKYPKDEPRPEVIPINALTYSITPTLVRGLTLAHSSAGNIAGMRFSHYGSRKLELKAKYERIANMVFYSANSDVSTEEVTRVLAGDVLHPRKRIAMTYTRTAGVLCDTVGQATARYNVSTPELCETYLQFAQGNSVHWANFVGNNRGSLIEIPRGSIDVRESVSRIYEWINEDDLVSGEPVLRAAALYWYLLTVSHTKLELLGIMTVMDHELRAGRIDHSGWLMLNQRSLQHDALNPDGHFFDAERLDLTLYFEEFATAIGKVLFEVYKTLCEVKDDEERLPWLSFRPPDTLDRQIFDVIESLGSAKASQIIEKIEEPPPLRTLQRRLLKLCKNGLLTKHGSRRDAYYQIT